MSYSLKPLAALAGLTAVAIFSSPCQAEDLSWSFVNTGGVGTPIGAVVSGEILGLNDPGFTFSPVTVTLDSISTGFAAGFYADSWTSAVVADVSGGVPSYLQFSATDGTEAITLDLGSSTFVSIDAFSQAYDNYAGNITFAPLDVNGDDNVPNVPDISGTFVLLAGAMTTLGAFRSRFASRR